jgi:putative transposase
MSTLMDDEIKRWTARRKSALVLEIIQGKTTVAEASRAHDLPPSEIESWVEDGKRGMENALRANPQDVREQYEKQLKDLQEAYGEAMLKLRARKIAVPAGRGREVIETIRQGLKEDGLAVSVSPAVSLVRCSTKDRVLPADEEGADPAAAVSSANQATDRRTPRLRLSNRRASLELQQEHRTACFPVDAMAGEEREFGVTRACGLVGISRSRYSYRSRRADSGKLRERIGELAGEKRRYGYRRIHVLLRREGWQINRKRTYRLYREAGLAIRRRKRKRIAFFERKTLPKPSAVSRSWLMDFVADGLVGGRKLRCLVIVDDYSRECLVLEVDTSINGRRVAAVLDRLGDLRGLPVSITVDHGPEFEGQVLDTWAYERGVRLNLIRPGKPVENAYVESFNGRFRDECLNEHWFLTMAHAHRIIDAWHTEYNTERPHCSLGDLTPEEYAKNGAALLPPFGRETALLVKTLTKTIEKVNS